MSFVTLGILRLKKEIVQYGDLIFHENVMGKGAILPVCQVCETGWSTLRDYLRTQSQQDKGEDSFIDDLLI